MDQANQNSSGKLDWMMNFGMPKNDRSNDALDRAIYAAKNQAAKQSSTESSSPESPSNSASLSDSAGGSHDVSSSASSSDQPRSAQEIINSRYQNNPTPRPATPRPTLSARDAINSAHSKTAPANSSSQETTVSPIATSESAKPASRLHRGFIQKSMESTRPSASAILGTNSPDGEVPVVSTSLKLGANARPQKPVATLPPNARMARSAKSVDHQTTSKKLLSKIGRTKPLEERSVDAQIILPEGANLKSKNRRQTLAAGGTKARDLEPAPSVKVKIGNVDDFSDSDSKKTPTTRRARRLSGKVSQIPVIQGDSHKIEVHSDNEDLSTPKVSTGRRARQPLGIGQQIALGAGAASRQLTSDPQMISPKRPRGPQKASLARPQNLQNNISPNSPSQNSAKQSSNSQSLGSRSLSNRSMSNQPTTNPASRDARIGAAALHAILEGNIDPETLGLEASDLRAIAAAKNNQDLKAALAGKTVGDLGVVEDYAPAERSVKGHEPEVVGNVGLSARDPKNPKAHKAEDSRRTLGKQSPFFLKSVNVEKRPLSHDNAGIASVPARSHEANSSPISPEKPVKLGTVRTVSRKSVFDKAPKPPKEKHTKEERKTESHSLPDRPTVIVPSSHRSNAPLFFLVILTIILGAAVGAAAYLCFFQ